MPKALLPLLGTVALTIFMTSCGGGTSNVPSATLTDHTTLELDALNLINAQVTTTTSCGAQPVAARAALTENTVLKTAAQTRAQWMADHQEHAVSADFEQATWARISQAGFAAQGVGELRLSGPQSAQALVSAVLGHTALCAKLMDRTLTHIGVSHVQNGADHYWVIDLARPVTTSSNS